jgi:hypothetical protein
VDDVDRLIQRIYCLRTGELAAAHRLDRIREPAGADAELEASAGEQVEADGRAGEHGGRAKLQVDDIRREVDALGAGRDERQQGPRVNQQCCRDQSDLGEPVLALRLSRARPMPLRSRALSG